MPDAFGLAGLLVVLFLYGMLILPFLLLGLAIPYLALRQRDAASGQHDPQLGIKAGLYYFFSVGILLALNGLTIIVVDAVVEKKAGPGIGAPFGGMDDEFPNVAQRVGAALIVSGLIFTIFHLALINSITNDRKFRATRRTFVGWRFAIHGGVVLMAASALLVIRFQKTPDKNTRNALFGVLLVWGPSWFLHLVLLAVYSRKLYGPPAPMVTLADD